MQVDVSVRGIHQRRIEFNAPVSACRSAVAATSRHATKASEDVSNREPRNHAVHHGPERELVLLRVPDDERNRGEGSTEENESTFPDFDHAERIAHEVLKASDDEESSGACKTNEHGPENQIQNLIRIELRPFSQTPDHADGDQKANRDQKAVGMDGNRAELE